MSGALQNILATEGEGKVAPKEGERFDVAGAHLIGKVKDEDSGYAFPSVSKRLHLEKAHNKSSVSLAIRRADCYLLRTGPEN